MFTGAGVGLATLRTRKTVVDEGQFAKENLSSRKRRNGHGAIYFCERAFGKHQVVQNDFNTGNAREEKRN